MRKLTLVLAALLSFSLNTNAQQVSLDALIERDLASMLSTYKALHAAPELSLFAFHLTWAGASAADEDAATRALMADTTRRGRVMVTGAVARGRYVGRACVLSFRTHAAHIDALVEDLAATIHAVVPKR